jgi:hypothetical protein
MENNMQISGKFDFLHVVYNFLYEARFHEAELCGKLFHEREEKWKTKLNPKTANKLRTFFSLSSFLSVFSHQNAF